MIPSEYVFIWIRLTRGGMRRPAVQECFLLSARYGGNMPAKSRSNEQLRAQRGIICALK